MRIAALITCHNRKANTLACLNSLFQNLLPEGYSLDVYMVDDGSTDGTEQNVRERFPQVNVISGNGNLYWNGGMRVAFAAAIKRDFDYYLWLNDDTNLYPDAIGHLISTHDKMNKMHYAPLIIVGSTQDRDTKQLSYGGWRCISKWHSLKLRKLIPQSEPVQCDTINGNCVLISRGIVKLIGNLNGSFKHSMGDMDYGFRARKYGGNIWVAPGFLGTCNVNAGKGMWSDIGLPLKDRWRLMLGEKGLPPKEWLIFTYHYGGWVWPILWVNPYLKFWISGFFRCVLIRLLPKT